MCLPAAWQEVEQKLEGRGSGDSLGQGPIQYTEKTPSASMKSKCPRHGSPSFAAEVSTFSVNLTLRESRSRVGVGRVCAAVYLTRPRLGQTNQMLVSLKNERRSSAFTNSTCAFCADFVPIDLEDWWARRFLDNIANLS